MNFCQISHKNSTDTELVFSNFPSFETKVKKSSLILSIDSSKSCELSSPGNYSNNREKFCRRRAFKSDLCDFHYYTFWCLLIEKEEKKCPITAFKSFSFELGNSDKEFVFNLNTENKIYSYPFFYSYFDAGFSICDFLDKLEDSNFKVNVIEKAIKRVENEERIGFQTDIGCRYPIKIQYLKGILSIEKQKNNEIKLKKFKIRKKEMGEKLNELLTHLKLEQV